MLTRLDPAAVPKPASAYSQVVVHPAGAKRIVISGQIGMTADGRTLEGLDAQVEQAFKNLVAAARAAGAGPEHMVRITAYMVASPDGAAAVATYRKWRDQAFEGHRPASTYVVVAGLASPAFLFEVEGEAIAP